MSKKILVPIAHGTEEMEVVTIIDIMVRAGFDVTVASADSNGDTLITASRGVKLTADCLLVDVADHQYDAILLAGGVQGAESFRDSTLLVEMIKQHTYEGRLLGAICAAPAVVLQHHQIYPEALMTCHPSFKHVIPEQNWRERRVTIDVNCHLVTSQGPGTALEFAMEIVTQFVGKEEAWKVAEPMVTAPALNYQIV
jgi:4-methyl-5(b-hydroxyethyl)-thiazole monophosphate biosynthesis